MDYGVHVDGVNEWTGDGDAFAQLVDVAGDALSTRDYGVFADTRAFYAAAERSESLTGWRRLMISLAVGFSMSAVDRFRARPLR